MSVAASYAGLTRSSYSALSSSVTTAVGTLTLDHLAATYDAINVGSDVPTMFVTTKAIFSIIERLLFPTTSASYNAQGGYAQLGRRGITKNKSGLGGEIGFNAIFYRGVPIVADDKCTSGYLYMLNENYLHWSSLPHPTHPTMNFGSSEIEGVNDNSPKNHGIVWTGLKEPINADGETGQFLLYGQMICEKPSSQGVLQGITG